MKKVLIIPGSIRQESFNRQLGLCLAKTLHDLGAEAALISLADYPLPIFNENDEKATGAPQAACDLAAKIVEYDGVILLNPEYNGSITPLMKNMLDWLSRDVGAKVYENRIFAIGGCSPGGLGGIRALAHLRDVLVSLGADIITPQIAVGGAFAAFDGDQLKDERTATMAHKLCQTLLERA